MPDIPLHGTLNTALLGVYTHKLAMNVVAHNIANASTPGYSRQRPVIEATPPIPLTTLTQPSVPLQMGTGSRVKTIERLRDLFLDIQYRQVSNRYAYWDTVYTNYQYVEKLLMEPGENGIRNLVDSFWDSLQQVMADPANPAAKGQVVAYAQQMTMQVKDIYSRLWQLRDDINNELKQRVAEINQMLKRLADINEKVRIGIALNSPPNDLLDERDRILDELSTLVDLSYAESKDGQITLRIGDQIVLNGSVYNELRLAERPYGRGYYEVFVKSAKLNVNGGKLKALFDLRDSILVKYMRKLDEFVLYLTDTVNLVHRDGFDVTGLVTGLDFFKKIESTSSDPAIFRVKGNRRLEQGPYHVVTGLRNASGQEEVRNRIFSGNDLIIAFGGSFAERTVQKGETIGDVVDTWDLLSTSLGVGGHAGGYRLYLSDTGDLRDKLFISLGDSFKSMGFETETRSFLTLRESALSDLENKVYSLRLEYTLLDGSRVREDVDIDLTGGVSLEAIRDSINSSSRLRAHIYSDPTTGERMLLVLPGESLGFDFSRVNVVGDDDFLTISNAFLRNYNVLKYSDTLENIFYGQNGFDPTQSFSIKIGATRIEFDPTVDTLEDLVRKVNEKGTGVLAELTPHRFFVLRAASLYDFDLRAVEIEGPQGLFEALGLIDPDADPSTQDWTVPFKLFSREYDFNTLKGIFRIADLLTFDRAQLDEPLNLVYQFEVSSSLAKNPGNLAVDIGLAARNNDWNATAIRAVGGANVEVMKRLYELYTRRLLSNGKESFYDFFGGFIGELGVEAETSNKLKLNTELLRQEIDNARESVKGVSLDEEMTNMIRYQHAFNAAAKLITVIDEMLATIVNMVR